MLLDLSLPLDLEKLDPAAKNVSAILGKGGDALIKLGHVGTHLDRVLRTQVPLEYFKSRGLLFDVSALCGEREVGVADVPAELVQEGDFFFLRTGSMARHGYGTESYIRQPFDLSWELIDLLLAKKLRFIGLDAAGVRRHQDHPKADARCEKAGTYVIENLTSLEGLPAAQPFTAYAAWFDMGGTGIPCRVLAELAD